MKKMKAMGLEEKDYTYSLLSQPMVGQALLDGILYVMFHRCG